VKKLLICLFVGACSLVSGQIQLRDFSIGFDYNNSSAGVWNQSERRRLGLNSEMALNDVFSLETSYYFDGNGYAPFTYSLGAPLYKNWGGYKFNRIYQEAYVGMRMYPVDNFHSQALALRNKEPYGVYVSYGFRAAHYMRREFGITTETNPVLDANGNPVLNDDGSVLQVTTTADYNYWSFTTAQWGVNFGAGWKQYHTKFVFTDLGVYSSVFMNKAVLTQTYAVVQGERIWSEQFMDAYFGAVHDYLKNGRGIELRCTVGINLDFRK